MVMRMNRFGIVTERVVQFRQPNGRIDEIDPRQISAVSLIHRRHVAVGTIFLGVGVLAVAGAIWVLIADGTLKGAQLLIGLACLAIGAVLWAGRMWVRIETTGGQVKSGSTSVLHRDDAETYVECVRAAVFR